MLRRQQRAAALEADARAEAAEDEQYAQKVREAAHAAIASLRGDVPSDWTAKHRRYMTCCCTSPGRSACSEDAATWHSRVRIEVCTHDGERSDQSRSDSCSRRSTAPQKAAEEREHREELTTQLAARSEREARRDDGAAAAEAARDDGESQVRLIDRQVGLRRAALVTRARLFGRFTWR